MLKFVPNKIKLLQQIKQVQCTHNAIYKSIALIFYYVNIFVYQNFIVNVNYHFNNAK